MFCIIIKYNVIIKVMLIHSDDEQNHKQPCLHGNLIELYHEDPYWTFTPHEKTFESVLLTSRVRSNLISNSSQCQDILDDKLSMLMYKL